MGTLPSQLGPLVPHFPLCNSTSVCALQVTLDAALGAAHGETQIQSRVPRIRGCGANPWLGHGYRRPLLSFLLGRFLSPRTACPKRETRRGPVGQVPPSAGAGVSPHPHSRSPQTPRLPTRAGQGSPGPRARGRPRGPEAGSCVRAQVERRRAPSSGARRAGLPASRRAHSGRGSSCPAGTRRCPWCCRRRAGRGRGEGGSQWRGR